MSTLQIRDLPSKTSLDGTELLELQEASGGAGSSKQTQAGSLLSPDYISGFRLIWNSASSLSVTTGAAFISSLSRVVRSGSTLSLTGLVLTASSWYHIYLYLNAGVPAIECVTTTPDSPYFGTARAKTGDASRRYIGSIVTDSSSNITSFKSDGGEVEYTTDVANRSLLTNGTATTAVNVSTSGLCPTTAISATLFCQNSWSSNAYLSNPDVGVVAHGANRISYLLTNSIYPTKIPLSSTQAFSYVLDAGTGNGLTVYLQSYTYAR